MTSKFKFNNMLDVICNTNININKCDSKIRLVKVQVFGEGLKKDFVKIFVAQSDNPKFAFNASNIAYISCVLG